jgi:hypothetical protein
MHYIKKRRGVNLGDNGHEDDPLSGVANLFDLSLVFIVAVLMALFAVFAKHDMLNPDSEWTITKKNDKGELEIISKKNNEIKVQKVTDKKLSGNGTRLGMAYKLEDGRIVYVEDSSAVNLENKQP